MRRILPDRYRRHRPAPCRGIARRAGRAARAVVNSRLGGGRPATLGFIRFVLLKIDALITTSVRRVQADLSLAYRNCQLTIQDGAPLPSLRPAQPAGCSHTLISILFALLRYTVLPPCPAITA